MFKSLSNVTCKDSYAVTSFDKTEGLKPEETLSITACNKDMAGHVLSIINNSCDNSNASYERVKPTSKICNMIEDCLENDDLEFYVAYEKGNPVGLMVTDNSLYLTDNLMKPHLYMNYIVTAIGSNGVGIKLLETAVNKFCGYKIISFDSIQSASLILLTSFESLLLIFFKLIRDIMSWDNV
jgi:hypothetical protein